MLDLDIDSIPVFFGEQDDDIIANNLIDKYNLSQESESFIQDINDKYYILTNYIIALYFDKKNIPSDIVDLLNNDCSFKSYLLKEIKEKMKNIVNNSSTLIFKELVSIINLLSLGKDYKIFTTYNLYSLENISKLFRDYEEYLDELRTTNEENYEITFNYYIALIETLNELCVLNQTDAIRKKTIKGITETLTESINIIKFRIPLGEEKINTLNNILGKLLFYYAHVPYVNIEGKDLKYVIDEYDFLLEKLTDGYALSKNTNFGNTTSEENKKQYYLTYLNNVTTLLLTLFYKLETGFELKDDFYDLQKFSQIIEHYHENSTHTQAEDYTSLQDFKQHLLNNYTYIYNNQDGNENASGYNAIIKRLIQNKQMSSESMNMIRNIILYSNQISEKTLVRILEVLLEIPKIKNDYFEFFKLNIIDIIILKFTNRDGYSLDGKHIKEIHKYIEENKIASHLMSMYSKIYLTLSLYHSYNLDVKSHDLSKDYYYGYVHINGNEQLNNEYKVINEKILANYGKMKINEFEIDDLDLDENHYINIGKKVSSDFTKFKEIHLKYEINQHFSNMVTYIFDNDGINNELLSKKIEYFISHKIFYGLVISTVEGLGDSESKIDDIGYEKTVIDLIDGFKLSFSYSNIYKHTFEQIYSTNNEYIKQKIINILISYLKSIPLYIDTITQLENKNKLEKDLILNNNSELIYINIYLDSLIKINETTPFNSANVFFKEVGQELNKIAKTYRTDGPRLAMVLDVNSDYKKIVEKIRDLKIRFKDEDINISSTISVSWGNSKNILDKSYHALLLASKNANKYYEFK